MNSCLVEFIVSEHTDELVSSKNITDLNQIVMWDCISHIVCEITKMGYIYREHYTLNSTGFNRAGQKLLVLNFENEEVAMLVRLGLNKRDNK